MSWSWAYDNSPFGSISHLKKKKKGPQRKSAEKNMIIKSMKLSQKAKKFLAGHMGFLNPKFTIYGLCDHLSWP